MPSPDVHVRSLATSTALSVYYMPDLITPLQVIAVLNEARIKFVLMGAHAIGGWMNKPRATEDVDVLVGVRSVKKAVRTLLAAFPHLEADDHEVVTRLRDKDTKAVAIDVMKPMQEVFRAALKNTHALALEGQSYFVPSLEMALALKFAAMTDPNRGNAEMFLDAHDFMCIIDANPNIDLDKLAELGELVYSGGGKEIIEKVRQVRAGETLRL